MADSSKSLSNARRALAARDYVQAETGFRTVLLGDPRNKEALVGLAEIARLHHNVDAGRALLTQAATHHPKDASLPSYLTLLEIEAGNLVAAERWCAQARMLGRNMAETCYAHGVLRAKLGDAAEALVSIERAVKLKPGFVAAHVQLGTLLNAAGRCSEAVAVWRRVTVLDPTHWVGWHSLAYALRHCHRHQEARQAYDEAYRHFPLAQTLSDKLMSAAYDPSLSASEVFRMHLDFGAAMMAAASEERGVFPLETARPPKLRIGYLSGDFRGHVIGRLIEPIVNQHDRNRFELVLLHNVANEDRVTQRLREQADEFVDIARLNHEQALERIRAAKLHILVDLTGHTAGNRMPVLARRAAPVQVTWMGYMGTTGLSSIDFRITDEWSDPAGETDRWHTEKLVRLSRGALCFGKPEGTPPGRTAEINPREVVFISANNYAKLNLDLFQGWARILNAVPNSRLRLHMPEDKQYRKETLKFFSGCGIAASRVDFFPRMEMWDYLLQLQQADILLDCFPYTGGSTVFDALWMGIPAICMWHERPFGGTAASVMTRAGLGDLVCRTPDEYVEKAVALADNRLRRANLAAGLREALLMTSLCDPAGVVQDLEAAYDVMWLDRLRGA